MTQAGRCSTSALHSVVAECPEVAESRCAALCRWVIPFSRQFFASCIGLTPLIPWAWKMALVKRWLIWCYYQPCRMEHLIPQGGPKDMNYTGGGSS